jgi:hypothetical protein
VILAQAATSTFPMQKIFQFTKADEKTHTVSGVATEETPDKEGETCNYDAAKKAYKTWSSEFSKATAASGADKSLGNIRVQHTDQVGGKATHIEYDDEAKQIYITSMPIDDAMWGQIIGGFYTGFSQGGDYAWRKCQTCGDSVRKVDGNYCGTCKAVVGIEYGPVISEVSYVDNPCHGNAHFDLVKADGSHQMVKFQKRSTQMEEPQQAEVLSPALAKQVSELVLEGMRKAREAEVAAAAAAATSAESAKTDHIKGLIKAFIDAEVAKRVPTTLRKDLYTVGRFAQLINEFAYVLYSTQYEKEIELDASTIPDDLQEDLENLVETFLAMAEEETTELTTASAERIGKVMNVTTTGLNKAYSKASGIIGKMKKTMSDHHEAISDANDEHHEKMKGHLDDLKECMGSMGVNKVTKASPHQETDSDIDEQEEGEIVPIDPKKKGTENIAEKSYSATDMEKAFNDGVQMIVKALAKKDDEEEDDEEEKPKKVAKNEEEEDEEEKPKKVTKGIGSRNLSSTRSPVIQGHTTVTKADDAPVHMVQPRGQLSAEVIRKAVQDGDHGSMLALMKSATPHNSVPATLVGAVSALGKSRR